MPAETWADPKAEQPPLEALRGRDAVVHLLGEVIAQRWTDEAKREIRDSRVLSTRNLVAALGELEPEERPRVLVSRSGARLVRPPRRRAARRVGTRARRRLPRPGVRRLGGRGAPRRRRSACAWSLTRTGVVLSESGGALEKMLPFFKPGVGGPVAGGRQYVPWVHLDDVVGATIFALDTTRPAGR